ncbi:zinc finger protein 181-like [Neocloeon triangulifer]|uniref:zinc finger protein 181-like n=1 Tax=Neocloeon triangulifer TaxID=2078957 RepID=UPI00286EE648|nr:zinc finger protein 181-like [Neocloeon triangulifer]
MISCRLCECPVVDGGLAASQVDLDKFAKWWSTHSSEELDGGLLKNDVFCCFCVWDARFLHENSERDADKDKGLRWWPEGMVIGSCPALEKHYLRNDELFAKPCWVKLTRLSEEEISANEAGQSLKVGDQLCCWVCKKHFKCEDKLVNHIQRFHKKKCVRCNFCPTFFRTNAEKYLHHKKEHGQKSVEVNSIKIQGPEMALSSGSCEEKVGSSDGHGKIEKNSTEEKLGCKLCPNFYDERKILIQHMSRSHKNEEWRKDFFKSAGIQCQKCNFVAGNKGALQLHYTRTHSDFSYVKRTLLCELCPKMFSKRESLMEHLFKKHGAIKARYKCTICDYACFHRNVLLHHKCMNISESCIKCLKCKSHVSNGRKHKCYSK